MIVKKKVLTWDIDRAQNDGYLRTGSFPLSLGDLQEFESIKINKTPLLLIFEKDNKFHGIFSKSRDKYPGELYSITESSLKYGEIFDDLKIKYNSFNIVKYLGFSQLFGSMFNIVRGGRKNLIIRKGLKIELYKTERPFVYFLKFIDKNKDEWRKYQSTAEREIDITKTEEIQIKKLKNYSLTELKKRINGKSIKKITSYVERFSRSPLVVTYALKRANGICELCKKRAPFVKKNGDKYLEVHHIISLSMGGEDSPSNALAVCPNCHREVHHGKKKWKLIQSIEK